MTKSKSIENLRIKYDFSLFLLFFFFCYFLGSFYIVNILWDSVLKIHVFIAFKN
jgi:hypothetical protein